MSLSLSSFPPFPSFALPFFLSSLALIKAGSQGISIEIVGGGVSATERHHYAGVKQTAEKVTILEYFVLGLFKLKAVEAVNRNKAKAEQPQPTSHVSLRERFLSGTHISSHMCMYMCICTHARVADRHVRTPLA